MGTQRQQGKRTKRTQQQNTRNREQHTSKKMAATMMMSATHATASAARRCRSSAVSGIKVKRQSGSCKMTVRSRAVVRPSAKLIDSDTQSKVARVAESMTVAAVALQASPAYALIDKRLNGDGTGKPLGINDPALFWVLLGVFGLVWGLYSTSVKDINPATDDDDGLSL